MAAKSIFSTIDDFLKKDDQQHPDAPYARSGLLA
jgi:hypothetical protein